MLEKTSTSINQPDGIASKQFDGMPSVTGKLSTVIGAVSDS
jgi:hypothetical protein